MSFLMMRALLFAGECLAASLLLPFLAYAATRLIGRAALRHLAWLTMFGVLAMLPLAALLLPARQIELAVVAPSVAPAEITAIVAPPLATTAMPVVSAAQPVAPPMPSPEPLPTLENIVPLLFLLWTMGVAWHLGRMALGGIGLARLRRHSDVFSVPGAPCELRLSPEVSGPSTFGVLRPVVLLPLCARGWTPVRLDAVLRHEAAHIGRHDALNQLVVRLVCAVYWPNPLLWLAAQALRCEAELAADDAALASGLIPSTYAGELVALAAEARGRAPGIAMAESALAARVQAALAVNISRKGVTRMDTARMLSLGLAATLLLGTARIDLALAQDTPANPARPAQAAPAAQEAPAAKPAHPASPRTAIGIDRNTERRIDIEVEAVKARADAVAAEARARAEAEKDPAKRAHKREEAAQVAAAAVDAKARAERTRQRLVELEQRIQDLKPRPSQAETLRQMERLRTQSENLRAQADMLRERSDDLRALQGRVGTTTRNLTVTGRPLGADGLSISPDSAGRAITLTTRGAGKRFVSTADGVTVDTQVTVPPGAEMSPEAQAKIDRVIVEAVKSIGAALAEAKAGRP